MNREAHQQRVEGRTVLGVERREELLLDLLRDPAQPYELALAVGGEADDVAAPVGRVAVPLDQAPLLERVEQADELAAVDAERVCDRRLRLAVARALAAKPSRASRKPLLSRSSCATLVRPCGSIWSASVVVITN